MSGLVDRLRKEFRDKEYRHAYTDEFLNSFLATQIKVLREQRGWNQERLAQEAGMKQSRISLLENVNYTSWSINTLKRLAEAFDVPLDVSFGTFGSRLMDIQLFSRESLERCPFEEDPAFKITDDESVYVTAAMSKSLKELHNRSSQGNVYDLDTYRAIKAGALEQSRSEGQSQSKPSLESIGHRFQNDTQKVAAL